MNFRKDAKKIAGFAVILILVLVMIFSGLRILESTVFYSTGNMEDTTASKTIERNGVKYFPRQDITVIMVLGIDKYGVVEPSGSYNNDGDADMVALLIFDETNKTVSAVCLNRDTMLEMPVLGIGGRQAGTIYQQLTLAHTYGSGLEDSCENMKTTVSNFLNGLHIDYYFSMNMDAISILNDAVGGVTVNVTDDFSNLDPSITMGEVTLQGQQAINFVRTRKGLGDQLNISRMERQRAYINGFMDALQEKLEKSDSFALNTYSRISPYIVTDISSNAFNGILQRYSDYELKEIVSPEGENVHGSEYMEFYVDEEALDDLILRSFYAPK
ncbi:MAG: LCP family protein [Oscillospiraceae bacterium]|nr:LCP family protein [Oscillospiraceae bacterium]